MCRRSTTHTYDQARRLQGAWPRARRHLPMLKCRGSNALGHAQGCRRRPVRGNGRGRRRQVPRRAGSSMPRASTRRPAPTPAAPRPAPRCRSAKLEWPGAARLRRKQGQGSARLQGALTAPSSVPRRSARPLPISPKEDMTIKVGINGFGRIGRMVFRAAVQNFRTTSRSSASTTCSSPTTWPTCCSTTACTAASRATSRWTATRSSSTASRSA